MAKTKKLNRNPRNEKYRDLKRVRVEWERYKDAPWYYGESDSGAPLFERMRDKEPPLRKHGVIIDEDATADYTGRGRWRGARALQKMNGAQEWLGHDGDAWGKPDVIKKSSRKYMRDKKEMWDDVD